MHADEALKTCEEPAAQTEQLEAPAAEYCPAAQVEKVARPAEAHCWPEGHAAQLEAPADGPYWPAMQLAHAEAAEAA